MSWSEILGHRAIVEKFGRAVAQNRLPSTFLFVGPEGVGKRLFARQLAKSLLCERQLPDRFDSCDQCPQCQQVSAGSHPDLIWVERPEGKHTIPLAVIVGGDDYGPGLCHDISLKPFYGGRKIAVINDADYLYDESTNALLKTLEEPPEKSVLILLGTSEQRQLPTIRSRCQTIRFGRLESDEVAAILNRIPAEGEQSADAQVVLAAAGSMHRALLLRNPEVFAFREEFLNGLATLIPTQVDFPERVVSFLGGKEADSAHRRDRLRLVADLTIEFFAAIYGKLTGLPEPTQDLIFEKAVAAAADRWTAGLSCLAESIERTNELYPQIGGFLTPANIVPAWLGDLTQFACGRRPLPAAV